MMKKELTGAGRVACPIADVLSHLLIALSVVFLSFFILDRFNRAMNFINNAITKGMLVFYGVFALAFAAVVFLRFLVKKSPRAIAAFALCAVSAPLSLFLLFAGAVLNILKYDAVKWALALCAVFVIAACVTYIIDRKKEKNGNEKDPCADISA